MPAKSEKQRKFMQAVAHSPAFAKKAGVPQSVGREYSKAKGGDMAEDKKMVQREVEFMKRKGAPKSMVKHEMAEAKGDKPMMKRAMGRPGPMIAGRGAGPAMAAMKKGGKTKKYAAGGLASGHKAADGIAKKGKTKGKKIAMAKGGMSC